MTRGAAPYRAVDGAQGDSASMLPAPPAEAEQPPDGETVHGILALLQSGGLVAAAEANAYMALWGQLDEFRQRAARCILVDALLRKQEPDGAVKHIRAVLADNN